MPRVRRKPKLAPFEEAASAALKLADQHRELTQRIQSLEGFISEAPGRAAERQLDRMETIPAPDELPSESYRHPVSGLEYTPRLSRSQAALLRGDRRKNMLVFIITAGLFAAFAFWLSQTL
jgi:hypothetical protein